MKVQDKIFIGGEWVTPASRETLEVISPFAKPRHESVIPFGRKVRLLCRLGSPQEEG